MGDSALHQSLGRGRREGETEVQVKDQILSQEGAETRAEGI